MNIRVSGAISFGSSHPVVTTLCVRENPRPIYEFTSASVDSAIREAEYVHIHLHSGSGSKSVILRGWQYLATTATCEALGNGDTFLFRQNEFTDRCKNTRGNYPSLSIMSYLHGYYALI
jgi:hypothetical protein